MCEDFACLIARVWGLQTLLTVSVISAANDYLHFLLAFSLWTNQSYLQCRIQVTTKVNRVMGKDGPSITSPPPRCRPLRARFI